MPVNDIVASVSFVQKIRDQTEIGTASGFFYQGRDDSLYFVTNRHVVLNNKPDTLRLRLHTDRENLRENKDYDVPLVASGQQLWRSPPSFADADVAAVPLDREEVCSEHFVKAWTSRHFLPAKYMLHPGEDVFIVGYPLGFHDQRNNLPVFRNAMVASSFRVDFQGRPFFLTDANLHAGTSGSPVLTKPRDTWVGEDGSVEVGTDKPGSKYYLVGVHSGVMAPPFPTEDPPLGLGVAWYAELVHEAVAGT